MNSSTQSTSQTKEVVRLTPIPKITPDMIIGYTYGMRPFRKGGFRLEREDIQGKAIFHNYGHGGAGVSLAPGCAKRIVDKFLMEIGPKVKKVAIIGSGYMGLFQSIMLRELGYEVNVYAELFPQKVGMYNGKPIVTSQVAGGLWMPFGYEVGNRPLHNAITKESFLFYKDCIEKNKYKGVSYKDDVMINYENPVPLYLPEGLIKERYVKVDFGNGVHHDAIIIKSMLIDGDVLLNELLEEAKAKGVKFHNKRFNDLKDVLALEEEVIFNCSGHGSYKLFGDKDIIPIAGHLIYINKVPGIDYFLCSTNEAGDIVSCYPHGNKLAIGLAYEKLGFIDGPVQKTLDKLVSNMNAWLDKYATPKPKL